VKTNVVQHPIDDPAAWKVEELRTRASWRVELDETATREIDDAVRRAKARNVPLTGLRKDDFSLPTLSRLLAAQMAELAGGRGFFLMKGLPVDRYAPDDVALMLWGIGLHVGVPEPQDRAGHLMHDVRDTGQSVDKTDNVRGYQTNQELTFHNDGADAFLLLCLKTARSGGVSKLVSAVSVFNEIVRTRPDLAAVLQQPFHFDARAQHPADVKVQSVPIFTVHDGRLSVLYKRHYIELAQRFADVPRLSSTQLEALDLLDRICADPRFCLEFTMDPGDLQAANNFSILHSRTDYVDHIDPAQKRHLKRLWLSIPNGREVPPAYRETREFGPTWLRRQNEASHAA
jgi:hypothetical protein